MWASEDIKNASRNRQQRDWHRSRCDQWQGDGPVQSLIECLDEAVRHHDSTTAHIVLDSALNLRLIDASDLAGILKRAPVSVRRALRFVDGRSQSGSETVVRLLYQRHRVPVIPQAFIRGLGYTDLAIGRSLLIECDSVAHHTGVATYENDRRRDLIAHELGYRTVRLTYHQVWHDWPSLSATLLALVRRREHLRPVRT